MILAATLWPVIAVTGLFGAILGSFLNVCIYRIPRGLSIVTPPSACPHCRTRIAPYDNVPVLGWIWLAGKCRHCRTGISPRYPVVEALTGILFVLLAMRYGVSWELLPALVFTASMIVVTLVDFDARIIPDSITLPGTVLGLLATLITPITFVGALIGAGLGFLLLLGVGWGYQRLTGVEGMGGGDIKLAAMLGAFLGWQGFFMTLFLASLVGSLVGLGLILARRGGRRTALPFGSFLAPAAVAAYVWGPEIQAWYAGLFRP